MSMNYTIAIANEKGGVAKTTSAVSLAGAFVEMGLRVLVIDLDPQSNATTGSGAAASGTTTGFGALTADLLL